MKTQRLIDQCEKNTRFLVTGGSGFIGHQLCQVLLNAGHHVSILTRNQQATAKLFNNDVTLLSSLGAINDHYDVIINLAGESLTGGRWNKHKKQKIYHSRLQTTQAIIDYIKRTSDKPSLLISGSAIGFYGASETQIFSETSTPADDGLTHDLCYQWEQIALQAKMHGVRVATLRTGIVIGTKGGALAQMLLPFKYGLGGKMGSGKQWMSWIHIDDLIAIIIYIITHKHIEGAINATAPIPVTNREFTQTLGKTLHRPSLLPIPALGLQLLFGEMAKVLLLQGQHVIPKKILDAGYEFQYSSISSALKQLLANA